MPRTTFFFKFCESLLATIAVFNVLMMFVEFLPRSFREANPNFFGHWLLGMMGIAVLSSSVYATIWHRRERRDAERSGLRHAWLQGIIRYWLAFEISVYGFAKILKTQLQSPNYRLDIPLGEVNGFGLTWYYFGYSYTLAVIIALFQIGGSILLLYRRTTLLGVMVLLPVMVNIVFVNLFYDIAAGAFFNSVVFTLGLVFLLLLDVPKLKAAFWALTDRLPPVTLGWSWTKHVLRLFPIAAAFTLIWYFVKTDTSDHILKGTWSVEKLIRNGRILPANAWLNDTMAWNRVYFAGRFGCVFSPNPYRYKPAESLRGDYEFDGRKNSLQAVFWGEKKADTLRASVSERTDKTLRLRGILRGDTLDLRLARLK
ncbi:MAG: hypothetical protein H7Y12_11840 [Sphingobacteriaceae bacterium]|nr:hypothetical protein [Cytophagaceae bacterium]